MHQWLTQPTPLVLERQADAYRLSFCQLRRHRSSRRPERKVGRATASVTAELTQRGPRLLGVGVLRWLFDLVIIVGYFATAFVLGSWPMAVAPFVLALLVVAVTVDSRPTR